MKPSAAAAQTVPLAAPNQKQHRKSGYQSAVCGLNAVEFRDLNHC
jgi:hypothetical protein